MPLVSIRRFLEGGEDQQVLWRLITLFLQGIGRHAVEGDPADLEAFRRDIERISETIEPNTPPEELLIAAGSVMQAVEDYTDRTSRFVRRQGAELQNIISMLTRTVMTIGVGSELSVQHLEEIEKQLESAVAIEEVSALKARLKDCLAQVREETLRQRTESAETIRGLQKEIGQTEQWAGSAVRPCDSVTGLSPQDAAVAAFQESLNSGAHPCVVTMVVNRIQPINARFGNAVGDAVLRTFGTYVGREMGSRARLFRWSGPTLVALMQSTDEIEHVRATVKRMVERPVGHTFEINGRPVLIPISAAWMALVLSPPITDMVRQIQKFVASQGSREYA